MEDKSAKLRDLQQLNDVVRTAAGAFTLVIIAANINIWWGNWNSFTIFLIVITLITLFIMWMNVPAMFPKATLLSMGLLNSILVSLLIFTAAFAVHVLWLSGQMKWVLTMYLASALIAIQLISDEASFLINQKYKKLQDEGEK